MRSQIGESNSGSPKMRTFVQKQKPTHTVKSGDYAVNVPPPIGQGREVRSLLHLQRTIGNRALQRFLKADARKERDAEATNAAASRSPSGTNAAPSFLRPVFGGRAVVAQSAGVLQRDLEIGGNMAPLPEVDPEDPFNCELLTRIEGVTSCTREGYGLEGNRSICLDEVCPGHPDYDPRQHPDYQPEGDEAEILVKYRCYSRRNCEGKVYAKYTHCHNCDEKASGKSLLKPSGCENC